jgi:hypothetical protein
MVRRILAAFALVVSTLALPSAALAAAPQVFHSHFTDDFTGGDLCGVTVDGHVVVNITTQLFGDGHAVSTGSVLQTFTNPANGKAVTVSGAGPTIDAAPVVDEQAGTITFTQTYKGLPEKIQTVHGSVLTRDAGIISFVDTFDLTTSDFLGEQVIITGPHPEADADFNLFCQVVVPALT